MPTRRNNNEVGESFAIGSKIEYMNKLYEIVEDDYCGNCAISDICCNSDVSSNTGNVLSRGKRINIFGECSPINRKDNKSVVFKEIPINISDNNTINSNIIQPLVEANGTVKALQIKAPVNFEIDKWNSNLDKGIIKFKRKWLTIEDIYRLVKENDYLTYRSSIVSFRDGKLIALANLMDIARYFNGNWKYDVIKENIGYMIVCDISTKEPNYSVRKIDASANIYCGNIIFENEADAQYVIDNPNFRNILDKIFKV